MFKFITNLVPKDENRVKDFDLCGDFSVYFNRWKFFTILLVGKKWAEEKQEKAGLCTRLPWFTRSTDTVKVFISCCAIFLIQHYIQFFFTPQFPLTSMLFFFRFMFCCFFGFFVPHTNQHSYTLFNDVQQPQMTLVQPSGEMSAKIREELREPDADAVAKDIAAIREWLEKQPHLPKDMGKAINWSMRVNGFITLTFFQLS